MIGQASRLELRACLIFASLSALYLLLAALVSGDGGWWIIDYVDGQNVFYGDDAYRFFLARSAWTTPELYAYNFVLPGQLVLDGAIVSLAGGDLFLSRCVHAVVGAATVAMLYLTAKRLGCSPSIAFCAVMLVALLPRYAMMSLSFYGELWLALFIVLALYFYLRAGYARMAVLASWLPLLRPEGIFFIVPIWIFLVREKRWVE